MLYLYQQKGNEMDLQFRVDYDIFNGQYVTTLLGGEFPNCHGYGGTIDESIRGLKIRVYQLRRKTN